MEEKRLAGGRYRVVRKLGSGGMATVYLAQDERLERPVALKRMHSDLDPGLAERFQREAMLGASLNHPNVVRVFDVFEEKDDEVTTLVLEFVDGETLADAIRRGPLAPRRAIEVLQPLADALDHAHENGVVHRDVKPANVLLASEGPVKLADLGVATNVDVTRVTASGTALGSAAYMAPEQLAGEETTAAVDIYALATVAYEALTGRRARTGDNPMAIVSQVANVPAPELMEAWPDAPAGASAVLRRGMADRAEDRPESAARLVSDLREGLRPVLEPDLRVARTAAGLRPPPPAEAPPAEAPPALEAPSPAEADEPAAGRRRPGRGLIAGLVGLAIVAVVVALVLSAGDGSTPSTERPSVARPAAASPESVVRDFYTDAADDRFEAAWKLAGPGARAQLGGFEAFKRQLGTLRSVDFRENRVTRQTGTGATRRHPDAGCPFGQGGQLPGRPGPEEEGRRLADRSPRSQLRLGAHGEPHAVAHRQHDAQPALAQDLGCSAPGRRSGSRPTRRCRRPRAGPPRRTSAGCR